MTTPELDAIARLEALGRSGANVSICYGPCAEKLCWSVSCMVNGNVTEIPLAANDFIHCVDIATIEVEMLRQYDEV